MTAQSPQQTQSESSRQVRTHELDGLRAVAVTLVVALHSVTEFLRRSLDRGGLPYLGDAVFAITYSGLELFFVLSAILMLSPYLREGRRLRSSSYVLRRAHRIWPPYFAALVFGGLVVLLARSRLTWYSRQVIPQFSLRAWVAQVGIVNLGWTTFNGAWWSLTLEVGFYLLVPLLVLAFVLTRASWGPQVFVGLVCAVSVASFLAAKSPPRIDGWGLVWLAFQFLPCFLMGMVVARFHLPVRYGVILTIGGVILVFAAVGYGSFNVHAAFGPFWAGIVVLATQGTGRIRRWLAEPHLVWLGERSYSLFLVHFSVFYLVDYGLSLLVPRRTAIFDILSRGIGIPLALLTAMVLFWTVERRAARGLATGDTFWPWDVGDLTDRLPARR